MRLIRLQKRDTCACAYKSPGVLIKIRMRKSHCEMLTQEDETSTSKLLWYLHNTFRYGVCTKAWIMNLAKTESSNINELSAGLSDWFNAIASSLHSLNNHRPLFNYFCFRSILSNQIVSPFQFFLISQSQFIICSYILSTIVCWEFIWNVYFTAQSCWVA